VFLDDPDEDETEYDGVDLGTKWIRAYYNMNDMVDQIKLSLDFYFSLDMLSSNDLDNDSFFFEEENYQDFLCRKYKPPESVVP
jgi:hypothetical protein